MDISAIAPATTRQASVSTDAKPVISSDFETFLKMLSTQLQNQDPMNPVDSADYAVQLATFSSVEQQVMTNDLLENLISSIRQSGMTDLAGWVGMDALSDAPAEFDGTPVTLRTDPLAVADRAVLVVRDDRGSVVLREDLPLTPENYEWDGRTITGATAPLGTYSFELESSAEGKILSTGPVPSYSQVVEARRDDTGTVLVLEGGGTIRSDDVLGLRR